MLKELESRLLEKHIRPTAMRLLVLEVLTQQSAAISLAALENALHPCDRITVFRSLKTFEEKGLVHPINDGSGATKYALCEQACTDQGHHDIHVHFSCADCGETFCLPKSIVPEIGLPERFRIQEVSLVVKGTCARCSP